MDLLWPKSAEIPPSWNVAPTQNAPIVRLSGRGREMAFARWGLVPRWAKDVSGGGKLINARSETAAGAPMFRRAFAGGRCVVPVSGFYEWAKENGSRQPWYIYRADERILLLAGLCESWRGPEGGAVIETFTILTTAANAALARLHDRMPAVLEPEAVATWLEPGRSLEELRGLLVPAADGVLAMHRVGPAVNGPRNNGPALIEPAPEESPGLFGAA